MTGEIDARAVFLARAAALDVLYQHGEISVADAFERLVEPFLDIAGPRPTKCHICGDPPWRHWDAYCNAVWVNKRKRRGKNALACVQA